jgi:hypothetical protein
MVPDVQEKRAGAARPSAARRKQNNHDRRRQHDPSVPVVAAHLGVLHPAALGATALTELTIRHVVWVHV